MFKFKCKISEDNFSEYSRFHKKNSKVLKRRELNTKFIFPFVVMFIGVMSGDELDTLFWMVLFIGSVLTPLYIKSISEKKFEEKLIDKISEGKISGMFSEKEYLINEQGIQIDSVVTSKVYNWQSIISFDESESVIYMFANSIDKIIILKNCIGDEVEVRKFKEYLKNYIKSY